MSQEEIFNQVYEQYKDVFPGLLHASGGLPDTRGPGTSDVDISMYCEQHSSLKKFFPESTEVSSESSERTIYTLKEYAREVNVYCSAESWWNQAVLHRQTEIALEEKHPKLFKKAFSLKRDTGISTELAWARVLRLGEDYDEVLLDKDKTLLIADALSA